MTRLEGDTHRRTRDDGFTLVEILIAIGLLSLLMASLSGVILVSLKAVGGSSTQLSTSHDRQLVAVYLPRDLSSASGALSGTNVTASNFNCAPKTGPTPILVLNWLGMPPTTVTSPTPLGSAQLTAQFEADYVLVAQPASIGVLPDTTSSSRVVRYYCSLSPNQAAWSAPVQQTVAYGLSATSAPTAKCTATPGGTPGDCNDPTPAPIAGPPSPWVTLNVTDASGATYSITGQMRTNS